MGIRPGEMDRLITFQRKGAGRDAFNEPNGEYADVATVWARVRPLPGAERNTSAEMIATAMSMFMVWYDSVTSTIGMGDRIAYQGGIYNIRNVVEIDRRVALEFTAEADV